MGGPYTMDLRERVVAAVEGGMSRLQAARVFSVSLSAVINWMKRVRETGSVALGQNGRIQATRHCRGASHVAG